MLQGTQLIQNATKGPHIAFEGIRLILTDLRAHIVWSANHCHGSCISVFQDSGYAEVSKLYCIVASEEDILRLEIPV